MKILKRIGLLCLILFTTILPVFAGSIPSFTYTVPGMSGTAETGVLTLTENTNVGLDVSLYKNKDVVDKVTFWTTWSYSDTRKSNNVTATEGGPSVRSMNVNNEYHASGDTIRMNFKNANFFANTPYEIKGTANYH